MRTWLYNRIKGLTLPAGMGDRILSSGSADSPIKPFVIVMMGVEQKPLDATHSMRVQTVPFTVWCHDAPGSMLNIDDAAVALKNGLPTADGAVVGGMSVYELQWSETGEDGYDDHFKTVTRPVRFTMMTKRAG